MSNFASLGISPAPTEPTTVEFGEWLPDLPNENNPGALEALNVIPSEKCYVPFKDLTLQTGLVLPAEARGAAVMYDTGGVAHVYGATTDGVYVRQSATFSQRYAAPYTLYSDFIWQFVQFGNNIVALHPQVAPQAGDVGGSSSFTPLGGSPPIAACGARVGDFLVLGNLDGEADPDGERQPQRIRWSGFGNIDSPWITDPATQADFNDMPSEGGAVMGITGREYGTVFQERCISRMSYVGLPAVFDIETVEEERGSISTGCIVDIGALVFFIANDGFFAWNGTNTIPIGDNKVNRYFFGRLNYAARGRIIGSVDYANSCIIWAFPVGNGTALEELIIYSYKENRFSHAIRTVEFLVNGTTLSVSLDDLTGNLDTGYPISFDDGSFASGRPFISGFHTNHQYGLFTGAALAATIDTGESAGPLGQRVFVNNSRPQVNASTAVVAVAVAERDQLLGEAIAFGAAVVQELTGECPILAEARYMRFRVGVPAGATWTHARGIEVWRSQAGAA